MSAAGSPNDAAHAFHRLGRHPGRVGPHQLERWVVMLSEWWVAMTRYAQLVAIAREKPCRELRKMRVEDKSVCSSACAQFAAEPVQFNR